MGWIADILAKEERIFFAEEQILARIEEAIKETKGGIQDPKYNKGIEYAMDVLRLKLLAPTEEKHDDLHYNSLNDLGKEYVDRLKIPHTQENFKILEELSEKSFKRAWIILQEIINEECFSDELAQTTF